MPPPRRFKKAIKITKALVPRAMFIVHMLFAIWAATCVTNNDAVWSLMVLVGLFLAEGTYSIVKRGGKEPKWFSPCVFIFLMTVVPPIWILNLDMFHCMITTSQTNNVSACNGLHGSSYVCSIVTIHNYFDRKPLVYTIEEIMLLLLIVGRWMLPKGHVTRDQLSQLLFVYFGFAFDIMELFYLFEEPQVLKNHDMQYVILSLWTVSLLQFTIVVTTVKSRRMRLSLNNKPLHRLTFNKFCQSEMWGLTTTVILQDGPFLLLRLYCLIGLHIFSYSLLFYTVKNILVILLQGYRMAVLILRCQEEIEDDKTMDQSTMSLPQQSQNGKPMQRGFSIDRSNRSLNSIGSRAASNNNLKDFSFVSTV